MALQFNDLRQMESGLSIETDLCIVGSGPAGLSIAQEFAGARTRVLIVESGGLSEEADTQALYEIESTGVQRVMQQDIMRYRIFGGTSHIWTGRGGVFEPIDFQKRDWVPYSGWPLTRSDLDPFLERAGRNLGLGPHCYDERLWDMFQVPRPLPALDESYVKPAFWQFSKSPREWGNPVRMGRHFLSEDAPNIQILLHANVTQIHTNEAGDKAESLTVKTLEHKAATIKAKVIILCCGGIENARLLLASNQRSAAGVGNQHDTVGRFLMDHPGSVIGTFDPKNSARVQDRFGHYWLEAPSGRHVYIHGLAMSPERQAKEQLLHCAVFLEEGASASDPWHTLRRLKAARQPGVAASDAALAKAMFWKTQSAASNHGPLSDALSLLSEAPLLAQGLYRRFVKHRPPLAKNDVIDLYCLIEQRPDPDSRVTLSDRKDALGMPLSRVHWKISEQERLTVQRMGELVVQEFKRLGLPLPKLADWLYDKENGYKNFSDRAHPTGTTRISENPREGVVDANCRVHGVDGLYIAGSSVFPTAGHANPTKMIIAMALRLADHLKSSNLA